MTNSPSKTPPSPRSGKSISGQAALLSLVAALVGLATNLVFATLSANPFDTSSELGQKFVGGLSGVLLLLGFVCGVVALRSARRHGEKAGFGLGLGCVLLNGVLLGMFASGWVNRSNDVRARKVAQIRAAELDRDLSGGSRLDASRLDELKRELDNASKEHSRDEGRLSMASASYLSRLRAVSGEYNRSLQSLRQADVLNLETLQEKDQLQGRRELVRKFLAANEAYRDFQANAQNQFRERLLNLKVSPAAVDQAMSEFQSRISDNRPTVLEARSADAQWGNAMLGVIDLLELTWGDWEYDAATTALSFSDDEDTMRYEGFFDQMETAAEERNGGR